MAPLWSGTSLLLPLSLCALLAAGAEFGFDIKSEGRNYLLTQLAFKEPGHLVIETSNFTGDDFSYSKHPNRHLGFYAKKVIRNSPLPMVVDINLCNSYFSYFLQNPGQSTLKFGQDVMLALSSPLPMREVLEIDYLGRYDIYFLDCKPEGNNAVNFHVKLSQTMAKNSSEPMPDGDPGDISTATHYQFGVALLNQLAGITTPRLAEDSFPSASYLWEGHIFSPEHLLLPMKCTYELGVGGSTGTPLNKKHFDYLENFGTITFQVDTILTTTALSLPDGDNIRVNNHFKFTIDYWVVPATPTSAPTAVPSASPTQSPTAAPTAHESNTSPAPTGSPTREEFPELTNAPTAADVRSADYDGFYIVGLSVEATSVNRYDMDFNNVCFEGECGCLDVGNENQTSPQYLDQLRGPKTSLIISFEIDWKRSDKTWEQAMIEQDQALQALANKGLGSGIGFNPNLYHEYDPTLLVRHRNATQAAANTTSADIPWEWSINASRDVTVTSFEPEAMAGVSTTVRVGPRVGVSYQSNELRLRSCFAFPTSYLRKINATCKSVGEATVELTQATDVPSSELLLMSMDEQYVTPITTWNTLDAALTYSKPIGGTTRVPEGATTLVIKVPAEAVNLSTDFALCVRTIAGNTYMFAYDGAHGDTPPVLKFTCGQPPTPPPFPGGGVAVEAQDRRVAIIILAVVAALIFAIGVFLGARCCYKQKKQFTYQDLANIAGVGGRVDGGDTNGGIVMPPNGTEAPAAGHEEVGRVVARMREHLAAMEGTLQAKQGSGGGGGVGGSKRNGVAAGVGAVEMMHQGRKASENFDDDDEEEASDDQDQDGEVEGGGADEAEVEQYEREFRSVAIDDHDEDDGVSRNQSPQK